MPLLYVSVISKPKLSAKLTRRGLKVYSAVFWPSRPNSPPFSLSDILIITGNFSHENTKNSKETFKNASGSNTRI